MKIENLKVGQVIKSYRELCKLLEIKISAGSSKKAQIKEFNRFVKYHKEGNKFVIDEIYDEAKDKIDGRSISNKNKVKRLKKYENLNIRENEYKNIGVYKIVLGNDIYIGSTIAGFRKRFQQHNSGYDELMQHTYDLLQNGGRFEILYDMTDIEDEELIRMVEDEFIKRYLLDKQWNVINKKNGAKGYNKIYKKKLKILKIDEDKFYEAIQLLAKYGLINEEGVEL